MILCLYWIPTYVESYDFLLVLNFYVRRSNILFQLRIKCSNSAMALARWFGTRQTLLSSSTMKTDSWCRWSSSHHIIISSASIIKLLPLFASQLGSVRGIRGVCICFHSICVGGFGASTALWTCNIRCRFPFQVRGVLCYALCDCVYHVSFGRLLVTWWRVFQLARFLWNYQ